MPTTQKLPQPPLEGTSFFQTESGAVDTTVEPPEGAARTALALGGEEKEAKRERGKGRPKRKDRSSGSTEPGDATLDGRVEDSLPEVKRVKFNLEGTSEADDITQPLQAADEHMGSAGQDDVITSRCDTGDSSHEVDSELAPPPGEDVEMCIKRISSETQMLFSKWKETLQESESFESFFPSRVDELIKEAYALEENLKERKEIMRKRVSAIASTLQSFANS